LADANRHGIYRATHRVSAAMREVRQQLRVRAHLVKVRTELINLVRTQIRSEGRRLPGGAAEAAVARVTALRLPAALQATLTPVLELLTALGPLLAARDRWVKAAAAADGVAARLMTAPGIGPVTALQFYATLAAVDRFRSPGAVTSYLGLVPRERSSGTRHHHGAITKSGPGELRALLVQCAWVAWRLPQSNATLHAWVHRLAARRGRPVDHRARAAPRTHPVCPVARRTTSRLRAWGDPRRSQLTPRHREPQLEETPDHPSHVRAVAEIVRSSIRIPDCAGA
jgi:transposase